MTAPIIIQHPGGGQFLQQSLEAGVGIGQKQQALGLQKQQLGIEQERASAEIAARQQQLQLEERQVAANEAFRKGYGQYLQSRGEYYQQRAGDIQARRADFTKYLNSLPDPALRQKAQMIAGIGELDPRVGQLMLKTLFPNEDAAHQGHQMTLAANLWIHGGGTWGEASDMVGLPTQGDPKLRALRAPRSASQLNAEGQIQNRRLTLEGTAIRTQIQAAERDRQQYVTLLQNQALTNADVRKKYADPTAMMQAADSVVAKKYPNLQKMQQRYDEIMSELMGMHAPQLSEQSAAGAAPVIPDMFGGGSSDGAGQLDLKRLSDIIDHLNDLFEQQGAAGGAGSPF